MAPLEVPSTFEGCARLSETQLNRVKGIVSEHKYKVLYSMEAKPEGFTADEVPVGKSATDALFLTSIIYPEDGSLSMLFLSLDGRNDEVLPDSEWFKVWMFLTKRLGESKTLAENRREFCREMFNLIRAGMQ